MLKYLIAAGLVTGASAGLAAAPGSSLVGITRAVAVAERSLSAKAMEAELDTENGRMIYEIDLVRGATLHRATIDARSGKLLSATQPRIEGAWSSWFDNERLRRGAAAKPLATTLAAVEAETGGKVQEVEFDVDNGQPHYEIEVATAAGIAKMHVDAVSGQRLAVLHGD